MWFNSALQSSDLTQSRKAAKNMGQVSIEKLNLSFLKHA